MVWMAPKTTTTHDGTTVTDPTNPDGKTRLGLLFSDLVRIERRLDESALVRMRQYGEHVRRIEAAIAEARAAHDADVAAARAARAKLPKGKRSAFVLPEKPAEITGTIRQIYAAHGANYSLASKATTRIEGTIVRYWGLAPCTVGLAAVDLVYEVTQRQRWNLTHRMEPAPTAEEMEPSVDALARRMIADLESGLSIASTRKKHKPSKLATSKYGHVWREGRWASVEMTATTRAEALAGDEEPTVEHVEHVEHVEAIEEPTTVDVFGAELAALLEDL